MRFGNTETPTYAGAGGTKPAVVERMSLYDRNGNEVAYFLKDVDGTLSVVFSGGLTANGQTFIASGASQVILNLPTSDPQVAGHLWADTGVVKVSAGV